MTDLTTFRRPVDLDTALDADLGLDDVIPHPDFRSRARWPSSRCSLTAVCESASSSV